MKIAVITEISSASKNSDMVAALEGRGHEIINAGMQEGIKEPELQYIHTSLMAAILLNIKRVDLVVAGCGTGQGFFNGVAQYPGVCCGLITEPLDGWLFAQINDGNCISLALNKGYGWAAGENLRFIFDHFFDAPAGGGYPAARKEPQAMSRERLKRISDITHKPFFEILRDMPEEIIKTIKEFPGFVQTVSEAEIEDGELKAAINGRFGL